MSNPQNIQCPEVRFNPTVIPQGDGSFIIRPGKPIFGREKITIAEAARRFGTSKGTMHRLYDCGLVEGERPSPRKTLLYADSLERHFNATRDLEFWDNKPIRNKFGEVSRKKRADRKCNS